jgi:hypothetical protein
MFHKLSSKNVEEMNNTHAKLNELGKDDSYNFFIEQSQCNERAPNSFEIAIANS